jgi:toxin HigB-1
LTFDTCNVTRYTCHVIKTFADKHTQELYLTGLSRRFPRMIAKRAARKLEQLNAATSLDDLRVPPSNRLHALKGDRAGQHAISINDQWRICFAFQDGDAYEVEVCDYH